MAARTRTGTGRVTQLHDATLREQAWKHYAGRSGWNECVSATGLEFGTCFHILQGASGHLLLACVGEQPRSIFEPHPAGTRDLNSHFGSDSVDAAGAVAHQVETDNFEDPKPVAPGARIDVLAVAEFAD